MAEADGRIRVIVVADADKATREIKGMQNVLEESNDQAASIGDKLKNGLASAAKVGATAVGVAGAGVAALAKSALEGYGAYEQLVGGVDTLFKENSDAVQEFAANAYKTAGLSANQYMETVTSFSASLLQSLGGDTKEAARVADMAITDMSDNANKMGSDMESIQNAYQGFAKQNYMMLDNLKLGYGGTKEEMERLLADAQAISGIKYDISSYADVVEAIHVIQTQMGITGTTAKEASTTIQGSVASMGSAWENLVTGIADDNADLDLLIGNFVDSVGTVGENILPRLEIILGGVGDLVAKLAPTIGAEVPKLIAQILPSLLNAGSELVRGIVQGVTTALPQLLQAGMDLISTIGDGITQHIPELLGRLPAVISAVVEFISQNLPTLIDLGLGMLRSIADGILQAIPELVARLPEIVTNFVGFFNESLPSILETGVEILNSLVNGILEAIPDLLAALPEVFDTIVTFVADNLPQIIEAGMDILLNLVTGIIDTIPKMVERLPEIITSFVETISKNLPKIIKSGFELLLKWWDGIYSAIPNLVKNIPQVIKALLKALGKAQEGVKEIGKNIVKGLWDGISSMISWVGEKVSGFVGDIIEGAKELLGIHSPSRVFAGIGEYLVEGFAQGIDTTAKTAVRAAGAMAEAVTSAATPSMDLSRLIAPLKGGCYTPIPPITDFSIPAIARGTVIPASREFTSVMNGGGGLDMEALAATINAAVKSAMGQGGGGEINVTVNSVLDGKVIARNTVKHVNDMTRQAGKPVLLF